MKLDEIKQISIVDYAREIGLTPYKLGSYYSLKEHDSVRIDPGKNIFIQNSTGYSGSVIDFAMTFQNLDFGQAVRSLQKRSAYGRERKETVADINKDKGSGLRLPEKDSAMRNIFAYLTKTRGIDQAIVQEMVRRDALYQDIHKNCVFVSRDETGKPVFASMRGTNTYKKFVADAFGCDYTHGLFLPNGGNRLIVTESAIDAMSVMSILKISGIDHKNYDYLALSGCGKSDVIERHLKSHDYRIVDICLDNDDAGKKAAEKLKTKVNEMSEAAAYIELPKEGKDYNDVLLLIKSRSPEKHMEKGLQPEL